MSIRERFTTLRRSLPTPLLPVKALAERAQSHPVYAAAVGITIVLALVLAVLAIIGVRVGVGVRVRVHASLRKGVRVAVRVGVQVTGDHASTEQAGEAN